MEYKAHKQQTLMSLLHFDTIYITFIKHIVLLKHKVSRGKFQLMSTIIFAAFSLE